MEENEFDPKIISTHLQKLAYLNKNMTVTFINELTDETNE